jgi:hypothetical protein
MIFLSRNNREAEIIQMKYTGSYPLITSITSKWLYLSDLSGIFSKRIVNIKN